MLRTDQTDRFESTLQSTEDLAFARAGVAALAEAVLPHRVEDVRLATSELLTNALEYGQGTVLVEAFADDAGLVVSVSSLSDGFPAPATEVVPPDQRSGRGLFIVEHLVDALVVTSAHGTIGVECRFDRT